MILTVPSALEKIHFETSACPDVLVLVGKHDLYFGLMFVSSL